MDQHAYRPYGSLRWSQVSLDQKYRYTGKPFDDDAGIDSYYYGARYYDPVLCRFISVDPLADKYPDWSPYVYALDNPLKYTDPDGRWSLDRHNPGKRLFWEHNGNAGKALREASATTLRGLAECAGGASMAVTVGAAVAAPFTGGASEGLMAASFALSLAESGADFAANLLDPQPNGNVESAVNIVSATISTGSGMALTKSVPKFTPGQVRLAAAVIVLVFEVAEPIVENVVAPDDVDTREDKED